jgi:hypothetical protein
METTDRRVAQRGIQSVLDSKTSCKSLHSANLHLL